MNKEEKKDIFLYAKLIFIGALCVFAFLAILFKYFPDTVEKVESSQEVSFMATATDGIFIPDSEDWDLSSDIFSKDREYVQPIFYYLKNGYLYVQTINNETNFLQTSKIGRLQND